MPFPRGARVRRAALVGGLPVFLAGAVLAAQFPGSGSERDAQGAPDVRAADFGCTVTYSSERTGGAFSAELSMEVTGTPPTGRSVLSFRLSPGQRLAAPLDRWQAGRLVRLPVPLRTSAPTRVPLQGTYTELAESGPDRFALAGVSCRRSSALVTVADDGVPGTAGVTDSPAYGVGRSTTPRSADPLDEQRTASRDGSADEDRPPVPAGPSSDTVASPSPATTAPRQTTDPTGSAGPQPAVSPTRSAGPAPSPPESPPSTPTGTADPVPTPSETGDPAPVQPATPTPTGASRSTSPGLPV